MAFVHASKTAPRYEAVLAGGAAAGGISACVLAKAGLKMLMLEAGRNYHAGTETPMFQSNAEELIGVFGGKEGIKMGNIG